MRVRDRLLASTRFQQWALRFPLTRPIARRRAAALFDICAGFVYSQVLLACVRLRIFELLRAGPRSVAALSCDLALSRDALTTLLDAAHALGLLEWNVPADRCGLGRHGAALLGNPGLLPMIEHHALLYADLRDPVALLRRSGGSADLAAFWPYARAPDPAVSTSAEVAAYTSLMSASQSLIAADVLDAYDLRNHRLLLDLGGGDGTFCINAAARAARLRLKCLDLPAVAARARARFCEAGISDRAEAVGASFFTDELPQGADVISLIRVLHDHDDGRALQILHAARGALARNGTLLIAEPLAGTPGGGRVAEAYFGMYLLAMGSGKPRTLAGLAALLAAAGFQRPVVKATRLPMQVRVLLAAAA